MNPDDSNAQDDSFTLIGIWQEDLPMIASGWSTNYQFFEDGRVNFNHSQMDCGDSLISETGTYTFKKGIVKIKINSLTFISGGELQKATGSCGSEYEIVGGEIETKGYKRKMKFKIIEAKPLEDYDYLDRIVINEVSWFRMAHNPEDY
ncbi:hypothetical protein N9355_03270 [Crocinitomicaceae bacterium]|nr:hypothetical protein [Crocinitomicaceae bacterium]